MRILVITGLSGAGKSVALKTLEDIGCEAVDNAPLSAIPSMVHSGTGEVNTLAFGEDVRSRDFSSASFQEMIAALRKAGHKVEVIFLDCDNSVLQRRFSETRRKHPLAPDRPVIDAIQYEREFFRELHGMAEVIIDTSEMTSGDLRNAIREYYGSGNRALSLFIHSFSFRKGVPRDADIVFDVRFLRNPFYDSKLRELTGLDPEVGVFIEADPDEKSFFANLLNLLVPLLPRYLQEGKSYLTIAIGCTGGRHRSVFMSEKLAGFLKQKEYKVSVRHRDLDIKAKDKVE